MIENDWILNKRGIKTSIKVIPTAFKSKNNFFHFWSNLAHSASVTPSSMHSLIEMHVIPQKFCLEKTLKWRYHPFPSRPLMVKIPRHKENVENSTFSYMVMLYIKIFVFKRQIIWRQNQLSLTNGWGENRPQR